MSPIVLLYAAILLVVALGLLGAYRVLGTPSRLTPPDYTTVLEDVVRSVTRSASRLRDALDAGAGPAHLEEVAAESRKIFQTGYYQTLRLRPSTGTDPGVSVRAVLGQACEAYDWASRMIGSSRAPNPVILDAARRLLDAGDQELNRAARELATLAPAPTGKSAPLP
ncbi:MAG: hypothetical protein M3Z11_10180 [Candidatus Dormibacteraeota bacterium]|nr:hypothetical protein [Candidatus Dormibacteraeota bacterium]